MSHATIYNLDLIKKKKGLIKFRKRKGFTEFLYLAFMLSAYIFSLSKMVSCLQT